jgi:hypothetical protein
MDYQKLFNHMNEEFGLVLLQTEMDAIVNVVNEIQTEELRESCVEGRSEQLLAFKQWERDKCRLPWDAEPNEIVEQYLSQ